METLVKEYLEKKQKELLEYKEKKLIELGLCKKVYSGNDNITEEFPYFDRNLDRKLDKPMSYKIIACDVSNEEFNEILNILDDIDKYQPKTKPQSKSKSSLNVDETNNVASRILFIISISIYILGGAIGLIILAEDNRANLLPAFAFWVVVFINGSMFLGFKEIIALLDKILNTNKIMLNFIDKE